MAILSRHSEESLDPLAQALAPPAGETPEQRALRQTKETEARRVSERIDEQLRLEKQANSRQKIPVKVLMLGQAESGASVLALSPQTQLTPITTRSLPRLARKVHHGKKSFQIPTLRDLDVC